MTQLRDLTNERFGRLVVAARGPNDLSCSAQWWCKCDCGSKPKLISRRRLLAGNNATVSCGCYRNEVNRKNNLEDLTGLQIDRLTVLRYEAATSGELGLWVCNCQCGVEIKQTARALTSIRKKMMCCGATRCEAHLNYIGPILPIDIARALGLKHYFPGLPCKQGHFSTHLVSNQSCTICASRRGCSYQRQHPDKMSEYAKRHNSKPETKQRRNSTLKERRNSDPVWRYAGMIRVRIRKVMKVIGARKSSKFRSSNWLAINIISVIERQGLSEDDLVPGAYELDHIQPLCLWPWSQSSTSNFLVGKAANAAGNLQLLTTEQHRSKTREEAFRYNWCDNSFATYSDQSQELMGLIEAGLELPVYLEAAREVIYQELKAASYAAGEALLKLAEECK